MRMTLEEAIKHCEEVAEKYDTELNLINCGISNESCDNCLECAKEHRQLAEWLKELKAYDEARAEIIRKSKSGQWSEGSMFGMNFALGIIDKHIKGITENEEVNTDEEESDSE